MARINPRILSLIKKVVTLLVLLGVGAMLAAVAVVVWTFEVKLQRWPLFVYGSSFEVRLGDDTSEIKLQERLARLGYVPSMTLVPQPGQWARVGAEFTVFFRDSSFQEQGVVTGPVSFSLEGDRVRSLRDMRSLRELERVTLEPELIHIGSADGAEGTLCRGVPFSYMPPLLVDAVLLTEDTHFWVHHGIDLASIQQALKTNLREGRYVQGGSTITQQLVRMSMLTPQKTLGRKAAEIVLSLTADAVYSKERILEAYLNRVYLGHWGQFPVQGVAEAARVFFGKNLSQLDAADCALLAAVIRAPNVINPLRNPDRARTRRNMVLGLLLKAGKINAETYEEAVNTDPVMAKGTQATTRAPAFIDMVKAQLPGNVPSRGRWATRQDVLTSLDALLQHEATTELRAFGEVGVQGHIIVARPSTGEILALVSPVGPRQWSGAGGNPELVLPFLTLGALMPDQQDLPQYTLASPFVLPGETTKRFTLRELFYRDRPFLSSILSRTVPQDRIMTILTDFGLPTRNSAGKEFAIEPMTPMMVAQSYALLASLGKAGILAPQVKILGHPPYETPIAMKHSTVNPALIYLVNHLLVPADRSPDIASDVERPSEGQRRPKPSSFLARDAEGLWAIAYHTQALALLRFPSGTTNDRRCQAAALRLLPYRSTEQRNAPQIPKGVVMRDICLDSGLRATSLCHRVIKEAFLKGTQPSEWCSLHHEPAPKGRRSDK